MNPTLKKIWNFFSWVLVMAVMVLAFLLAGVRLMKITPYAVLSGSMEPVYPVGSMIYVRGVRPEDLAVGDPITFYLDEKLIATHRITQIDKNEQCFITKGDANEIEDAPVPYDHLIGKPFLCIPGLGSLSSWIGQPPGIYAAGAAVLVVLVLIFLPEVLDMADAADKKEEKRRKKEGQTEKEPAGSS